MMKRSMSPWRWLKPMGLATVTVCSAACASFGQPSGHPAQASLSKEQEAAQLAYDAGMEQMRRGLFQEAIRTFDDLKLRHPYSRFAPLAELRAADAYAKRDEHLTAIEGYRAFLRFHPNHPDAAYALEQIGEGFFAQIPRDFWPLPKASEKDLDAVRQAIETYQDLLARHAGDAPMPKAKAHLDACRRTLAEHELMVARFYHHRSRFAGALGRARHVLDVFPQLGFDAEALWLAASSLSHLGQAELARPLLETLGKDHPKTSWARRARKLLADPAYIQPQGSES